MPHKNLFEIAFPKREFATHDQSRKYHVAFLETSLVLIVVTTLVLGVYFWTPARVNGVVNFIVSLLNLSLLVYLKRHPEKVGSISTVALLLWTAVAAGAFLFLKFNTMRVVLFFPIAAAVFYLKDFRVGASGVLASIVILLAVPNVFGVETGYTNFQLLFTSFCLAVMFIALWYYEALKLAQFEREREYQFQRVIDERWRIALEGAGDAIWDWDIATAHFNASKSYTAMLGYADDELLMSPSVPMDLLHPAEKQRVMAHLEEYLNGDFSHQYVSEQRLRCKDGTYKWILCRGKVVQRDSQGRPARMVGTHVDVTERNQIREEILHSRQLLDEERRLFQTILDNAPLGIWMLDAECQLRFVNSGFCNATGISEAQFLGAKHYADVLPAAVADSCKKSDQSCFMQAAPHLSTEWIPFVDGREHLLEITKVRLLNKDDSIRGLIGIATDITERKEHEKQLQHIAHYDALTGVPNRVLLADRLSQALARAKRDQGLMAVCYLDLDGFKPVNDNFGHDAGDRVLVEITRRIKEVIREDDTVARLGGDEFVVLLVGMQAPEECAGSLSRLLVAINQPIEVMGKAISVSASIGVALYPEDDHDPDTLLRHADQAMYVAKQSGKNRYHLFDATNDQLARTHHELVQQISLALVQDEFELYYQPKVHTQTHRMVGAEALIRWHHPQRGLLLPSEFLGVISNTELEVELGEWVIASAIDQLRVWREKGLFIEVSINVSAYHLQTPNFANRLKEQSDMCCPGNCYGTLQVEVLETAALEDVEGVGNIIRECKAFGMSFALDDFGTGYSSLSYLSKFDVDVLKIDQSFVRDMLFDKGDHAIVQGIISLAKAFDMGIVAEGVETAEQYQALLEMGCEVVQGYGVAEPMPAALLVEWAANQKDARP